MCAWTMEGGREGGREGACCSSLVLGRGRSVGRSSNPHFTVKPEKALVAFSPPSLPPSCMQMTATTAAQCNAPFHLSGSERASEDDDDDDVEEADDEDEQGH